MSLILDLPRRIYDEDSRKRIREAVALAKPQLELDSQFFVRLETVGAEAIRKLERINRQSEALESRNKSLQQIRNNASAILNSIEKLKNDVGNTLGTYPLVIDENHFVELSELERQAEIMSSLLNEGTVEEYPIIRTWLVAVRKVWTEYVKPKGKATKLVDGTEIPTRFGNFVDACLDPIRVHTNIRSIKLNSLQKQLKKALGEK